MNVRLERPTAMTTQTVQTVKAHTNVFVNLDLLEMEQLVQVSITWDGDIALHSLTN